MKFFYQAWDLQISPPTEWAAFHLPDEALSSFSFWWNLIFLFLLFPLLPLLPSKKPRIYSFRSRRFTPTSLKNLVVLDFAFSLRSFWGEFVCGARDQSHFVPLQAHVCCPSTTGWNCEPYVMELSWHFVKSHWLFAWGCIRGISILFSCCQSTLLSARRLYSGWWNWDT